MFQNVASTQANGSMNLVGIFRVPRSHLGRIMKANLSWSRTWAKFKFICVHIFIFCAESQT